MLQYIVVFLFFVAAFALMLAALHFSQYKKRPSGCCGGGHCSPEDKEDGKYPGCYGEKVDFVERYKSTTESQ